jgi:hypothetical protein
VTDLAARAEYDEKPAAEIQEVVELVACQPPFHRRLLMDGFQPGYGRLDGRTPTRASAGLRHPSIDITPSPRITQ